MTVEGPGRLLKLQQWFKYNYPQILTLLGTVAVGAGSIGGLVDKEAWGWFVWAITLGLVATAAGGIAGLSTSPSVVRLIASEKQSGERAETLISGIRAAFSGELAQVLRFVSRYEPGARASLYLHVDDTFQIVSRSSSDPNLRRFGRTSYPPSQGVIGRAWSDSEAVAVDLPKRRDLWNAHMARNYGFSEAEAGKLRMQSRSLVALRIDHDGPAGARPLGVVVLESVKPTAMGSDERDSIMGSAEWRMFSAAVIGGLDALRSASFSPEAPTVTVARSGGSPGDEAVTREASGESRLNSSGRARLPIARRQRPTALLIISGSTTLCLLAFAIGVGTYAADPSRDPMGGGVVTAAFSMLGFGACLIAWMVFGVLRLIRLGRSARELSSRSSR